MKKPNPKLNLNLDTLQTLTSTHLVTGGGTGGPIASSGTSVISTGTSVISTGTSVISTGTSVISHH